MEWVLSLCLLYANTPKSTTQKPSPLGEGGADRRRKGETRSQTKTTPQPTHLSQRLRSKSPKKAVPPWGKVAPTGDGRGELALNPRLLDNFTTKPNSPRKQNRTKRARPYNTASELPLSEPSRAHLSPKGEAYCMNHACIYIESNCS